MHTIKTLSPVNQLLLSSKLATHAIIAITTSIIPSTPSFLEQLLHDQVTLHEWTGARDFEVINKILITYLHIQEYWICSQSDRLKNNTFVEFSRSSFELAWLAVECFMIFIQFNGVLQTRTAGCWWCVEFIGPIACKIFEKSGKLFLNIALEATAPTFTFSNQLTCHSSIPASVVQAKQFFQGFTYIADGYIVYVGAFAAADHWALDTILLKHTLAIPMLICVYIKKAQILAFLVQPCQLVFNPHSCLEEAEASENRRINQAGCIVEKSHRGVNELNAILTLILTVCFTGHVSPFSLYTFIRIEVLKKSQVWNGKDGIVGGCGC